jgi:3-dehydroquinate dehydratase/shikimate dehydrogenase
MAGQKIPPIIEGQINAKLVFDLVYNPLETPLIRLARQQGIPIITGVEMFVQQGARQFEIFTGKPAPEEEMLRVVIHALRQQAEASAEAEPAPKATPSRSISKPAPVKAVAKATPAKAAAKSAPTKAPAKPAPTKAVSKAAQVKAKKKA